MANSSEDLAAHLQSLEEQLLKPETRSDHAAIAALVADDFREFGSSGRIFTKAQIIAELTTESARTLSLSDFHCELLALGLALVTYRSTRIHASEPPIHALRSSLWVYREARWQVLFHQGTRINS